MAEKDYFPLEINQNSLSATYIHSSSFQNWFQIVQKFKIGRTVVKNVTEGQGEINN